MDDLHSWHISFNLHVFIVCVFNFHSWLGLQKKFNKEELNAKDKKQG